MRAVTALITGGAIIAIAVVVYAGGGFSMKCQSSTCGYESQVRLGGGMAFEQLTGYCRKCKKFVYLQWTREGSPVLDPAAKKVPLNKTLRRRIKKTGIKIFTDGLPCKLAKALDIFELMLEYILATMGDLYSFSFKFALDKLKLKDWINEPKSKPG
jgi:hypothetical protein